MKKIIIIFAACNITSCASLKYPNWEHVSVERTVFKKPCERRKEESCRTASDCSVDWYKKRATTYGANTIVMKSDYTGANVSAEYFYCAAGIAPFIASPDSIWIVRNKFNPAATQLDFDKTVAKCDYETSKAALNTAVDNPEKPVLYGTSNDPFFSLNNTLNQIDANRINSINAKNRAKQLKSDTIAVYNKCLEVDGFVSTYSNDEKALYDLKKNCPGIDNTVTPCFITGPIK